MAGCWCDLRAAILWDGTISFRAFAATASRAGSSFTSRRGMLILTEDVPAFVRCDGPLYLRGPVWRMETTSAR